MGRKQTTPINDNKHTPGKGSTWSGTHGMEWSGLASDCAHHRRGEPAQDLLRGLLCRNGRVILTQLLAATTHRTFGGVRQNGLQGCAATRVPPAPDSPECYFMPKCARHRPTAVGTAAAAASPGTSCCCRGSRSSGLGEDVGKGGGATLCNRLSPLIIF